MFGASLRAALNSAAHTARALMSVATTASAWVARCSAWTPHPVPRSRARATGSRSVSWASEVAAGLMPSTWSSATRTFGPSRPGVRSETTHRSRSSVAYGRTSSSARTSPPEVRRKPACSSSPTSPGRARSASSVETAVWSRNSRVSVASGEPSRRPPQGRRGLVAAERLVGAGAEQVGDGVVGEAGGLQGRAQTKGQVRHVGPAPLVVSRADRRQTVGETGWVGVGSLTGAGGTGVSGPSLPMRDLTLLGDVDGHHDDRGRHQGDGDAQRVVLVLADAHRHHGAGDRAARPGSSP